MPRDSADSSSSEDDAERGSVIHRTITTRSRASQMSGASDESQGSVIRREDQGTDLLPLPVTIEDEGLMD